MIKKKEWEEERKRGRDPNDKLYKKKRRKRI